MLTPYQVVTVQTIWTVIVLLYGAAVWLVFSAGGIIT